MDKNEMKSVNEDKNIPELNDGNTEGQPHIEEKANDVPASAKEEKATKKKNARKRAWKSWRNFFIKLFALALIGYVLMTFVFSFEIVNDISMQPRLSQGDLSLLYHIDLDDIDVDEVVAYTIDGQTYFGRVKGKPGDVIDITDSGSLYINNAIISESHVYFKTYKEGSKIEFPYTVPENSYFILGDNRENCFDSRICGAVQTDSIIGKLIGVLRRRGF